MRFVFIITYSYLRALIYFLKIIFCMKYFINTGFQWILLNIYFVVNAFQYFHSTHGSHILFHCLKRGDQRYASSQGVLDTVTQSSESDKYRVRGSLLLNIDRFKGLREDIIEITGADKYCGAGYPFVTKGDGAVGFE